jgi:S-DNA-T family DNA segregation ATPase FtsK/SpoIIIE
MAKNKTPEKDNSSASKATSGRSKKKGGNPIGSFIQFLRSDQGQQVMALTLIALSLASAISFVSHFFSGYQDQSLLEGGGEAPKNWLGAAGAWISQLFVSRGFGLLAILIPAYTALWGFALLESNHFAFVWKLFKHVLFATLWGSAFLGFLSFMIWGAPSLLGGGFGWYINEMSFFVIGKVGMAFLLVAVFMIYLVVQFNVQLPYLSKWLGKVAEEEIPQTRDQHSSVPVTTAPLTAETIETDNLESEDPEEEEEEGYEGEFSVTNLQEKPEEDGLHLDPSLPSPDQIPEISTYRDGEVPFEFAVADVNTDEKLPFEEGSPDGDNIMLVEEDKYEKIIPDQSQETLEEDEILAEEWALYDPTLDLRDYQYPTIDLLMARESNTSREVNRAELEENKNKIVQTLMHYKIDIQSIKATIGPTVTLYEIVPAPGVRISKIRNLEDDIALSLSALGIRIIAPIPGKGTIGIEIPNSNPEIVAMRSVMGTEKFRDTKAEIPLLLGRTISNEVYIADLTKMPHLLIAGATGQGKSVGINGILTSILYKKHPSQVKLVLIDPKKVELNLYAKLEKHFLAKLESFEDPIITDTKQVIHVLNSLCIEMDSRYDLLKVAGTRNLKDYNEKFIARKLNPRKGHRFLPHIVLVIDEFADLMMTAGKEIETPIARLAQLARAIGIHLILATQRPSVNVITGTIKANFPARISFRVTSKIDSRTILDTGGADQLIGRGDLLLSTGSDIVRIQNAFVDTPEVEKVVDFIANQRGYPEAYILPEVPTEQDDDDDDDDADFGGYDPMFKEAARLVVRHQQGSTSLIQRRMKLGYNRAGRIMDQLERAGIVGSFSGSKAREVLVHDEISLEQILSRID